MLCGRPDWPMGSDAENGEDPIPTPGSSGPAIAGMVPHGDFGMTTTKRFAKKTARKTARKATKTTFTRVAKKAMKKATKKAARKTARTTTRTAGTVKARATTKTTRTFRKAA